MNIEWKLKDFDKELAAELSDECEIPRPIANILVSRGILTKEDANDFCEKNPKFIRSYTKLPDFEKACNRLVEAINKKE